MNHEKISNLISKTKNVIADYSSHSDNEFEFDDYLENLKYSHKIKGGKDGFFILGTNLDWRGAEGYSKASSIEDVARKLLMHGGQCNTTVWREKGNTLKAVSYHHDCPTGSWFTVMTMSKARKLYPTETKYFK